MSEKTPFTLPVRIEFRPEKPFCVELTDAEDRIICDTFECMDFRSPEDDQNLKHIAHCLNTHAALVEAFTELLATVRGECPSLLNEDSGASAVLIDLVDKAEKALAAAKEGR